jgi:hypothetical protein
MVQSQPWANSLWDPILKNPSQWKGWRSGLNSKSACFASIRLWVQTPVLPKQTNKQKTPQLKISSKLRYSQWPFLGNWLKVALRVSKCSSLKWFPRLPTPFLHTLQTLLPSSYGLQVNGWWQFNNIAWPGHHVKVKGRREFGGSPSKVRLLKSYSKIESGWKSHEFWHYMQLNHQLHLGSAFSLFSFGLLLSIVLRCKSSVLHSYSLWIMGQWPCPMSFEMQTTWYGTLWRLRSHSRIQHPSASI